MEIISKPNKDWYLIIECKCGAKLRAHRVDFHFISDRDGNAIVCKCPVCRNDIWTAAALAPGPL